MGKAPQSRTRVIGRFTLQSVRHWSALSFPRDVVPNLEGTQLTQEGSSRFEASSYAAVSTVLPSTAFLVRIWTTPGARPPGARLDLTTSICGNCWLLRYI